MCETRFATGVAILFCTAVLAGQGRPDFTGTWLEDEAQRKTPYATSTSVLPVT